MLDLIFKPLPIWPRKATAGRRISPYRSRWEVTLRDLERELGHLKATEVDIALGVRPEDLTRAGQVRAGVKPTHPGVEVSFLTPKGRFVYVTDACIDWKDNVRSVALGLEALRAVNRYGITPEGEQYRGFMQLEDPMVVWGRELIAKHGTARKALMATHPDRGGSAGDFQAVQAASEVGP